MQPLLEVRDLRVVTGNDGVALVDGLSFTLNRGETLGIVGESGCGKSLTSLALMGLLPRGMKAGGEVRFEGADLLTLNPAAMRDLRGDRLAMIFQDPMTSLNPALTIGFQIAEGLIRHRGCDRREARDRAIDLLRKVRLPAAERRIDEYPHQLSGGMRQRVMIAMALICQPTLLIADEPTTALDVTVQAQILDLLRELKDELRSAMIFISHDLGVVAENADRVAVLYAGRIVEEGPTRALFEQPEHPYTIGLMGSIPRIDVAREWLPAIGGTLPLASDPPPGCRFEPRCPFAAEVCREASPELVDLGDGHFGACWKAPL
ncbi:ABC transporter ATP-binding protein [Bradyrhizobium sp. KB893862 SZCCT0404]|uniref:ABC transporter ATP-binding protein n=1 Tax=Bradyrhizobium sp. KB893862 SZCCT0404 TaxID=2807672 RepID=UPI002011BB30|nr:ABC transporter ATP-binding protein [Bradyrhizobium sp. KB893862 SZCCT0404]